LVLIHSHYYLMVCPAVALLCGAGAARTEQILPELLLHQWFLAAITGLALVLAAVQGLVGMKIALEYDRYPATICGIIIKYTSPTDKLIIFGGGWGGRELFCSHRAGLSVQLPSTLPGLCEGGQLQRLRMLGYNRLVMLSESPLLSALQEVNPGSHYQRRKYPASVSPTVDSWPILFQNADIVIKEIPTANAQPPSG